MLLRGTLWKPFLSSHASINVHHADEGDSILFDLYHLLNCSVWPQLTIKSKFANLFSVQLRPLHTLHALLGDVDVFNPFKNDNINESCCNGIPRRIFIPVQAPKFKHPKKKIYFYLQWYFLSQAVFLLHLNKVYFQEENIPFP